MKRPRRLRSHAARDALDAWLDRLDEPLASPPSAPVVRGWQASRFPVAVRAGASGAVVSLGAAAASFPLLAARSDTRAFLLHNWKWFVPAAAALQTTVAGAIGYFLLWQDDVTRLDHAFAKLSAMVDAESVESAGEHLAELMSVLFDADSAAVYVRSDESHERARFRIAGKFGELRVDDELRVSNLSDRAAIDDARDGFVQIDAEGVASPYVVLLLHDEQHVFGFTMVDKTFRTRTLPVLPAIQRGAASIVARFATISTLRDAAMTDPLTGLANRRRFDDALAGLRPGDAVVMMDLDHFKQVNDRHGHAVGDAVLRDLAGRLLAVAGPDDTPARYGGEEFGFIVRASRGWRARSLLEGLARDWRADNPITTFSAGIAEHNAGSPQDSLGRADAALYEAKEAGRNTIVTKP